MHFCAALNKLDSQTSTSTSLRSNVLTWMLTLVGEGNCSSIGTTCCFRRAKQAIQRAMRAGAKGIKTQVSGRLNGADIARAEGYSEGTVPLHTLRVDIDYAWEEADTTYGKPGVKVWIYRVKFFQLVKTLKEVNKSMLVP